MTVYPLLVRRILVLVVLAACYGDHLMLYCVDVGWCLESVVAVIMRDKVSECVHLESC